MQCSWDQHTYKTKGTPKLGDTSLGSTFARPTKDNSHRLWRWPVLAKLPKPPVTSGKWKFFPFPYRLLLGCSLLLNKLIYKKSKNICNDFMHFCEYLLIFWPLNPKFQKSWIPLNLSSFCWFQYVGYFPTQFLSKNLMFNVESKIPSFLESSWNHMELWNSYGNGLIPSL